MKSGPFFRVPALRQLLAGRSLRALGFGFLAIGLLIVTLIGVSLHSMSDIRHDLDRLGNVLQVKNEAIETMRENLYLRLVSSRDMMVMEDVFKIDEEAQRFHIYASRIGRAHARFLEQVDNPEDRALAEKFIEEARNGMPLLNSAVNELLAGKRPSEIQSLLNRAFDSQKQALDTLQHLQERVHAQSLQLTQDAVARYNRTRILIVALTLVALILVLAIAMVVSRRMIQQTEALDRQRRRYKTLFDANRDAVLIVQNGALAEGNRHALELFDFEGQGKLRGMTLATLSAAPSAEDGRSLERMLEQFSTLGGTFEWTFRDRTGQPFIGEVSSSPLPSLTGNRTQMVVRDVTERTLALRKMSHDASHDPMTGLANRREFERRVNQAIESARAQDALHALGYLDLDRFKEVNDLAGHDAGDELLKRVASVFKAHVRTADLVARLGGDEFGLLLENCTIARAENIVKAIIAETEALRCETPSGVLHIGASVGLTTINAASPPYDQLLRLADQACYEAKRSGTHLQFVSPSKRLPGSSLQELP